MLFKITALLAIATSLTSMVSAAALNNAGSVSATVASSTDSAAVAAATSTESNPCVAWEFLTTRGSGDLQDEPWWMANYRHAVLDAVPGGKLVETRYEAGDNGLFTVADIVAGAISLSSYANSRGRACPNTKFILASFSKGAGVQGLALPTMTGLGNKILGITYWGSPFYGRWRWENVGTATRGTGILSWLGFRTPWRFRHVTADICVEGDSICTGVVRYGDARDTHANYRDTQWDTYSIDFMIGKLRAAGL